jgi:hypothetical protein
MGVEQRSGDRNRGIQVASGTARHEAYVHIEAGSIGAGAHVTAGRVPAPPARARTAG